MALSPEDTAVLKAAAEILKREALAGSDGDKILVRGFGVFKVGMTKAQKRMAFGKPVESPARKTFRFTVSKGWLE